MTSQQQPEAGAERAHVHRYIERKALIGPAQQLRGQNQVRRGGNGEEFRDALNQRQCQSLKAVHGFAFSLRVMARCAQFTGI